MCLRDADDEVTWLDLHAVPPAVQLCGRRPGASQTGGRVPSAPWGTPGPVGLRVDLELPAPPFPDPPTGVPAFPGPS